MMKIISLSEGNFTVDRTKSFIPFDEEKDFLQNRTTGSLLVEIQPFAIITQKDILILDTGLGFVKNKMLQLHSNLLQNGIQPRDVTKVLLSHLHKDHSGGISQKMNETYQLSFPNAEYFLQERELNFALKKGTPSFFIDGLQILKGSRQVTLLKNDIGVIDNYIRYQVTSAHSPFHQVFWIEDQSKKIFYGGDDAPQLQQMKHRFKAKYDYDGKKAMELRRQWWEQGEKENWNFLFYHDLKHPIFNFDKIFPSH